MRERKERELEIKKKTKIEARESTHRKWNKKSEKKKKIPFSDACENRNEPTFLSCKSLSSTSLILLCTRINENPVSKKD